MITNIGPAHLDTFGSLEGVRRGKWGLVRYLNANGGHFFTNTADPWIRDQEFHPESTTFFGADESVLDPVPNSVRGQFVSADPNLELRYYPQHDMDPVPIRSRLFGAYNFDNVMAAIAVGRHFKIPLEEIIKAIEQFQAVENRSQTVNWGGNTYIFDSGSVNPASLNAALENFGRTSTSKKIVVLADMLRLGGYSAAAHREAIHLASRLGFDQVIFVGEWYWRERDPEIGIYFRHTPGLRNWWSRQSFQGATILVKGAIRFKLVDVLGLSEIIKREREK